MTLQPAEAALAGAVIGLLGGVGTVLAQRSLEYKKWVRSRADDIDRSARVALADLASASSVLAHTVAWFSYNHVDPFRAPTPAELARYDDETHKLISDVVSAQVRLAALRPALYRTVVYLSSEAINLSEAVDTAVALIQKSSGEAEDSLLKCNSDSVDYIARLATRIADAAASELPAPSAA
jgi:hypothetical protein